MTGLVRYVHGGSDSLQDEFTIAASDGVFTVYQDVPITVMPLNDELPTLRPGLTSKLVTLEGGQVAIGSGVLSATDPDTNDLVLQYIVVQHPLRGVILKGGLVVNRFSQKDVDDGLITYHHTAGEIWLTKVQDTVTFLVSDSSVPTDENLPTHRVTISVTPVDNQHPGIIFGNPFFVLEGQKNSLTADIISALDRDSTTDQLTFHITRQPEWGYVENVRPNPGSREEQCGHAVDSFTFDDIQEGDIKYVQSVHQAVDPTSDSFVLYISDGERSSPNVTFLVNINPRNDEKPTMRVTNFTVYENSFYKILPNFMTVGDLDIPMEMLLFSIMDAPRHGMLVDRAVDDSVPVYDFNLNQFQNTMKLAYVHDGSESTSDSFDIRVSDGKHVLRRTAYVTIVPVNDERPQVIKNAGLELSIHEHRLISPLVLLTSDLDTSDEDLLILIHSLPQRGRLQRKVSVDVWEDVTTLPTNFTQRDVNLNLIRYQHVGDLGTKGIDRFRFSVTDGQYKTGKETFRIVVEGTKRLPLEVWNQGLRVREASYKVLTPDHLSATDHSDQIDSILYTVLTDPTEGQLEDVSRPEFPLHRSSGRPDRSEDYLQAPSNDRVTKTPSRSASEDGGTKNETVHSNNGFILSNMVLHSEDECGSEGILYIVTREPSFGHFENTETRQRIQRQFTQEEIDQRLIMYVIREEAQATNDSFTFEIHDCAGNAVVNKRCVRPKACSPFRSSVWAIRLCPRSSAYAPFRCSQSRRGYVEPRANQLQFDPFETVAIWNVQIVEDDLEENRERFRVRLQEPFNALLGEFPKMVVVIKNAVDGYCAGENPVVVDGDSGGGGCCDGGQPPPHGGLPDTTDPQQRLPFQPPVNIQPIPDFQYENRELPDTPFRRPLEPPFERPLYPNRDFVDPHNPHYDQRPIGEIPVEGECCPPNPLFYQNPFGQPDGSHLPPLGHQGDTPPRNPDLQDVFDNPAWRHALGGDAPPNAHNVPSDLSFEVFGNRRTGNGQSSSSDGVLDHIFAPSVVHGRQEQPSRPDGEFSSSSDGTDLSQFLQERESSDPAWIAKVLPCSGLNEGEVRLHHLTGSYFMCDGASWQKVSVLSSDSEPEAEGRCEEGWIFHQQRCYMLSNSARTWDRAQRRCGERYNGHLVSILSADDQNFIRSMMSGLDVWIGLNDKNREGHWEWISGDQISFSRWKPNTKSKRRDQRNCVYMNTRFRWVDDVCDMDVRRFICMKDAVF
ncbi:putative FRAS1-related extracellular matrix protein 1 [Apostichopus japonicus]|uniref:Putative FRAS1-related extracellular matrix protein 1 n=1 Tax=Stichopus japonicus TaxID=307972 RepID=A0A2G8LHK0_STIJA|nr:putative FRAS1-related extracellular matrix protein 1 [Apostichopus japonicus]